LVAELKQRTHATILSSSGDEAKKAGGKLMYKVIDSMIVEYFKFRCFDFSLSVFLPEAGLTQQDQVIHYLFYFRSYYLFFKIRLLILIFH